MALFSGWSLSDKIAAVASLVAFLQFCALIATIFYTVRNGRRQLRAYIHTLGKNILVQDDEADRFVHSFTTTNAGQTPAYKLHVEAVTKPLPHPLPRDFDFAQLFMPKGRNPSVMMVGPHRSIDHDSHADTILSSSEMIRIKTPESGMRLYTVGKINYEDCFGRRRFTNFCYFLEWQITPKGHSFSVHPSEHNDAN
ncbi:MULTISPECIES: hypothetical protein [unclassified Bradyrhizobium]|uniref:hypothetical protein n=1 Tax=unclassified Bradyrhizobium TaxID=2631580 RepID=UPI002916520B|nr:MULTISPECIES: hypothetical protein [unclassified Bradyrhizobium]